LDGILKGLLIVGMLALVVGIHSAYLSHQTTPNFGQFIILTTTYLSMYLVIFLITVLPKIIFYWRVGMVLVILYGLGTIGLLESGLIGDGRLYLFGFIIMTVIFLDYRFTIGAVALSVLAFLQIGWLYQSQDQFLGIFDWSNIIHPYIVVTSLHSKVSSMRQVVICRSPLPYKY